MRLKFVKQTWLTFAKDLLFFNNTPTPALQFSQTHQHWAGELFLALKKHCLCSTYYFGVDLMPLVRVHFVWVLQRFKVSWDLCLLVM